ncbi:MAG: hypothetical protein II930_00745 [Lachnospiraceae bacterium]|nr:hypothetical protein [Lachnospiraceae bacterium]
MKKFYFACICLALLFLTGCGARVVSETEFNYAGGGTRDVQIYLSDIVSSVSEEDLAKIDEILKAAVPEGMNYAREVEKNGEFKYHFMFSFTDIEDYNAKVLAFTGRRHHATWATSKSVFTSDIDFSEKECSYELASWAVKALQASEYKRFTTLFDSKTPQESVFYLEEEEVWRGSREDPAFRMEMAPEVTRISMYTGFEENEAPVRRLVLDAEADKMQRLDLARAKEELGKWCEDINIDRANGVITLKFGDTAAFRAFLKKADPGYAEERLSYENVISPYAVNFEVKEEYRMSRFFGLFRLGTDYVRDYISLPELPALTVEHLSTVTNPDVVEGYEYQGAYPPESEYVLHAASHREVRLAGIDVSYSFDTPESGERQVKLTFEKNGCALTKAELERDLAAKGLAAHAADLEEKITATVVDKIGPGNVLRFDDVRDHNPAVKTRVFADLVVLTDCLPNTPEGVVPTEGAACTAQVKMLAAAKADSLSIGDREYAAREMLGPDGAGTVESAWDGEGLNLEIYTRERSVAFLTVCTVILLIAAVIGSGIAIYHFRKGQAAAAAREKAAQAKPAEKVPEDEPEDEPEARKEENP